MGKYEYEAKLSRVSREQLVYELLMVIQSFDNELREVISVSNEDPEQKLARSYQRNFLTMTAIRDIERLVATTKLDIGDDLLGVLRDMRDDTDCGVNPFS